MKINTRIKNKIIGSDYSAQEPRMTAYLSQDKNMLEAYNQGKDLYAMIARAAFDNKYEDNLEFYPEGTEIEIDGKKIICGHKTNLNKAGKERRSTGKVLNLAATYGMSGATAGARLGKSKEEGEKLLENFFKEFSGVKTAIERSKKQLRETAETNNGNGYVEDWCGRRRHLPDFSLPAYEVHLKETDNLNEIEFNPFLICEDKINPTAQAKLNKWNQEIKQAVIKNQQWQAKKAAADGKTYKENDEMSNKAYKELATNALKDGVIIKANTGRRAQAERQCFNARIQGGAATLTKLAMIDIFNDQRLKDLQAKLIITVHDEVLVECPAFYADEVEKILPEIMINAAKKGGNNVPQSCDPYNVTRWYCDVYAATIQEELKKLEHGDEKKGILPLTRDEALEKIYANHKELDKDVILKTIETGCDLDF